jgi:putative membrane protein
MMEMAMQKALIRIAASAGAAVVVLPAWAWAQTPSDADKYAYGPQMMWWGGGWFMFFGPLFMILMLAALLAAVVLVVRWLGGPGTALPHHPYPGRTSLDILKERFARGEIDKQEFEERRRVLGE